MKIKSERFIEPAITKFLDEMVISAYQEIILIGHCKLISHTLICFAVFKMTINSKHMNNVIPIE